MSSKHFSMIFIWTLSLLIISCSSEGNTEQIRDISDVPILKVQQVQHITEEEDIFFTLISGTIVTDSEKNIFIGDRGQKQIFVFDDNGNHLDTFGREGSGPGEFNGIQSVFTDFQSDTLYVYDRQALRVSLFHNSGGNWEYNRTINFNDVEPPFHQPGNLIPISDKGFILEQTIFYVFGGAEDLQTYPLTKIDSVGQWSAEKLFRIPLDEIAVYREGGAIRGINFLPFGRKSILKNGPNGTLFHNWSDQLTINQLSISGDTLATYSFSLTNPPVQAEEKQNWIDAHIESMQRMLQERIPDTKPVVEDFFVDEEQRIWVKINNEISDNFNWLLFNPNGAIEGGFKLPTNFDVSDVKHGKLYGALEDEETGQLSVAVYEIDF